MQIEIFWDGVMQPITVPDGRAIIGSGDTDNIRISDLPRGFLTIEGRGDVVKVTAAETIRIGLSYFPAGVSRLLIAGEEVDLKGRGFLRVPIDAARNAARKNVQTAFLAKQLMNEFSPIPATRAASLRCVAGPDQGTTFLLASTDSIVGRALEADVCIRARSVSRRHMALTLRQNRCFARALSSSNPTFVNGQRVLDEQKLNEGDILEIGRTMLRFDAPVDGPNEQTVLLSPEELRSPNESPAENHAPTVEAAAIHKGVTLPPIERSELTTSPSPTTAKAASIVGLGLGVALIVGAIAVCIAALFEF